MLPSADTSGNSGQRSFIFRTIRQNLPVAIFVVLSLAIMLSVYIFFSPDAESLDDVADAAAVDLSSSNADGNAPIAPIEKPTKPKPVTQRMVQSPRPVLIGLIAGHRGSDSGTECTDGLTEVEINSATVERLAEELRQRGLEVDSLDEFDSRLEGYSATAVVSVHADSCDYVNELATGYKIAGSPYTDSSQLSICLEQTYGKATSLPYHPNSITPHMSDYHAFRKLAPNTQAAIIEIGFLNLDRQMLVDGRDSVVEGLGNGIACLLESLP